MNKFDSKELLKSLLAEFFMYNKYEVAIKKLREAIRTRENYKVIFLTIVKTILSKKFEEGEVLKLIIEDANLPLDDYTDDEAYKWLCLMIVNVFMDEKELIIDYEKFFNED